MLASDPPVSYLSVSEVKLAYRESGALEKPPMVLLHGLALSSAVYWRPLIERFQEQYRIIAFDLLGHGDSDKPGRGYDVRSQVHLMNEALLQLGIDSAVVVGHSLGGVIATNLALDIPNRVRTLILCGTPLPNRFRKTIMDMISNLPLPLVVLYGLLSLPGGGYIADRLPRKAMTHWFLRKLRVVNDQASLTPEIIDLSIRYSNVALGGYVRGILLRPNVVARLSQLSARTLIIDGDHDVLLPLTDASNQCRQIPHCELVILKNTAHYAMLENSKVLLDSIASFLDSERA